jgi:predicted flap endonuclease-1-like 5' DNA nuclease
MRHTKKGESKMTSLAAIEGIGAKYAEKLAHAGIRSTEALLERGGKARDRKSLSAESGISDTQILEWVNRADLFRIPGVGEEYSDLLENAGVDTVVELSKRVAKNLQAAMAEVNAAKNLVNRMPSVGMVEDWIKAARSLPRAVEY